MFSPVINTPPLRRLSAGLVVCAAAICGGPAATAQEPLQSPDDPPPLYLAEPEGDAILP